MNNSLAEVHPELVSEWSEKGYDTACADYFKSKEVYQSGY